MPECRRDGGCPNCNPELANVMRMSTKQYADWLTRKTDAALRKIRHAECGCPNCVAARAQADAAVRKAIADSTPVVRKTKEEWEQHYHIPPDGYAQALAKRGIVPPSERQTTYDPNDPLWSYQADIAKRTLGFPNGRKGRN